MLMEITTNLRLLAVTTYYQLQHEKVLDHDSVTATADYVYVRIGFLSGIATEKNFFFG